MYQYLKPHSKLDGWKSNGGNPCDDSWKGIKCSGSDVTEMYLFPFLSFSTFVISFTITCTTMRKERKNCLLVLLLIHDLLVLKF